MKGHVIEILMPVHVFKYRMYMNALFCLTVLVQFLDFAPCTLFYIFSMILCRVESQVYVMALELCLLKINLFVTCLPHSFHFYIKCYQFQAPFNITSLSIQGEGNAASFFSIDQNGIISLRQGANLAGARDTQFMVHINVIHTKY